MLSPRTKRQLRKQIFPPRPPTRTRSKNAAARRESTKNNNNNSSDGSKTNKTSALPKAPQQQPDTAAAAPAVDIDIRHIPHLVSSAWADPDPTPLLSHFAPDPVYVDHGAQLRILSSGSPLRRHHQDRWGSNKGRRRDDDDDDDDNNNSNNNNASGGGDSYDGVLVACEVDPDHDVWWRDVDLAAGYGRCRYRTLNRGRRIGGDRDGEVEGRDGGGEQQRRDSWQFSGVVDLVIEHGKIARFEEWRRLPVEDGARGGGLAPSEYKVLT
ncbi:hypothetical protein PpBr36_00710 [Pyricularia pennisetigena]|uniref:hypothetical protein n=1 Tax=Pyricularia pennisetigena TaxID=1578925 RepID=UPI001152F16D|nr:hypothetical protein PpBr36_00710 [Pyricularia pennisetigena]TLS29062.1 hypothetical protein PpBr36_00710 [Pyricularia pennisetigena]